jgi:MFS family permease
MPNNKLSETLSLLKVASFRSYIFLRFLVIFAVYAQSAALYYHVYHLTNKPIHLGLLGLAEFLPALLIALPAGMLADKHNKKTLYNYILYLYLFVAISFGLLTSSYNTLSVSITLGLIFIVMVLNGIARSMLAPVAFSILSTVAPVNMRSQAITWSTSSWYLGSISGPVIGSLLLGKFGIEVVSVTVIIFLLFALIALRYIPSIPPIITANKNENAWQQLSKGLKFVFSTEVILICLSLDLFAVLFGGAEALLPVFSKDIFKVGPIEFGWLKSAHGIGSLVLLGLLVFVPLKNKVGIKLLLSVAGFGACMIAFAISNSWQLAFVFLFIGGMLDAVSVVIRHSVLQLYTPEDLRGRVASVNTIFISSSNELGALESGIAATYIGTIPSVVAGGSITILICAVVYFISAKIKTIQLDSK